MNNIGKLLFLCIVLAACGGGWYYYHHKSEAAQSSAKGKGGGVVPVGVASAKTGDIDVYLSGLGNITPRNTVTVHTRVDGELMRVLYREGQMVKSGELLAELDARPLEATLEQAQGLLIRDEALLKEAKVDLKRYQTLFSQDSIAKQQLDTQASLVKQYEGAVKNDQGQVDNAKVQIIYTKITAPVNGRVGLRLVDTGNIVHASDTTGIVVVTELQPITAIFTIPEDNLPDVLQYSQGTKKLVAEAWDRDNKNKLATGALVAIDNQVDPTTGTVKYRAEFANKNNALFPSQFVNIRLKLTTKQDAVLMPTAGVQRGTQGTFVYLVKDNTVKVQPVTLGTSEGESVEVTKGLSAGDQMVIDGGDSLRDGAKIEVAKSDTATTAAAPPAADAKKKDSGDDASGDSHHKHKKHSSDNE